MYLHVCNYIFYRWVKIFNYISLSNLISQGFNLHLFLSLQSHGSVRVVIVIRVINVVGVFRFVGVNRVIGVVTEFKVINSSKLSELFLFYVLHSGLLLIYHLPIVLEAFKTILLTIYVTGKRPCKFVLKSAFNSIEIKNLRTMKQQWNCITGHP